VIESAAALRRRAQAIGQEHLFTFLEELDEGARRRLLGEIEALDPDLVEELAILCRSASEETTPSPRVTDDHLESPEVFPLDRSEAQAEQAKMGLERGSELLAEGRVACLLVAGGQASRLGYEGPKGTFSVGPVSGCSLFEMHARRLLSARRRWGTSVPCYVMTSPANDTATRSYFEEHDFFGLEREHVVFFPQGTQPAFDPRGRILMATRDSLCRAPDGHGGVFSALRKSGALEDARGRGVTCFSYVQVDNPLARAADPLYVGLHSLSGARMSSKVLRKRDAAEGLGVICLSGGRFRCIEYSDLSEELREAREPNGELVWGFGGIAMHVFDLDLALELSRDSDQLPWHIARKSIRAIDERGRESLVDGVKFERFVFDALAFSPRSVTLEVERSLEFCPLKNARGQDSPESVREGISRLHTRWVRAAGLDLPAPGGGGAVEVDPLVAESSTELLARGRVEPVVLDGGVLYRERNSPGR
jgi:UDP-N-acetylglucosamine/UDP-N-acetylgalactosamine diphosphorylase